MVRAVLFLVIFVFLPKNGRQYEANNFDVQINVDGIDKSNQGKVVLAIYDEENFLKKMVFLQKLNPTAEQLTTKLTLAEGKYCFSVYQDTNQNQKLDRNFIGIPKEPIAFSNNYKPFGPPKFKGCAVTVNKPLTLTLKMEKVF